MSQTARLKTQIHTLEDIKSIFGAMKNLAVIEISKVTRFIGAQERASDTINSALADFEFFYRPNSDGMTSGQRGVLCLLIGSERGFCGPFNERVLENFQKATQTYPDIRTVVVGRKLATKLDGRAKVELTISGPSSTEEVPGVINELSVSLLPFANRRWMLIHNGGGGAHSQDMAFFPLERRSPLQNSYAQAPLLNMPYQKLYPQLLERHLFAIMHRALYISFLAENKERLRHMEGALNRIEESEERLCRDLNSRRQEEITAELEILMLNVDSDELFPR